MAICLYALRFLGCKRLAGARRTLGDEAPHGVAWGYTAPKNQLLILLSEAVFDRRMMSVTLRNRIVYVGYVREAPSLDPTEVYFRVYPVFSGYREKDTLTFCRTTEYQPVQDAHSTSTTSTFSRKSNLEVVGGEMFA